MPVKGRLKCVFSLRPNLAKPTLVEPAPPPNDFIERTQGCADTFDKIATALKVLPIVHGLTSLLSPLDPCASVR